MDEALKQRLVGAVILIALAVIFLPMLLTGTDRGTGRKSDAELSLPPRPEAPTRQRRLPLEAERPPAAEEAAATQAPRGQPAPDTAEQAGGTEAANEPTVTSTPAEQQNGSPAASTTEAGAAAAETGAGTGQPVPGVRSAEMPTDRGWVIQVASLGDPDNVERLMRSLSALGFKPGRDRVDSPDGGTLHRVWLGPFAARAQVEAAMTRIRDGIDHVEPRIRGAAPSAAAEAVGTTTADDDPRFAVQMGVFAAQENAAKLRQRLLGAGYSASTRRTDSNGEVRYRVLVGPLLSRSDADHIRGRINRDVGIEGMIVEYP